MTFTASEKSLEKKDFFYRFLRMYAAFSLGGGGALKR